MNKFISLTLLFVTFVTGCSNDQPPNMLVTIDVEMRSIGFEPRNSVASYGIDSNSDNNRILNSRLFVKNNILVDVSILPATKGSTTVKIENKIPIQLEINDLLSFDISVNQKQGRNIDHMPAGKYEIVLRIKLNEK